MKKLLLSLMIVGAGIAASAQSPVKFGIKAGANFAKVSSDGEEMGDVKLNPSFYVGGTVDFAVSEIFSVQPGLLLSGKGMKLEGTEDFSDGDVSGKVTATAKRNLMYIEIPVNAVFSFPAGNGKVFLGAGPYYGIAVSGKDKAKISGNIDGQKISSSTDSDVEFGKDGDVKRGDFGVNFLGGYQLGNGFNIHAGYGLGLGNIAQDSDDIKVNNRVLSVGLGFSF
ncbi:hypothetical protein ABIE26_003426 [Pedobacter africanus]|uniref:Uncharacterized protein n=1 Tax=Pedobacter africanus TaxID=151894 RepID=A0ACC6KZI5_9SPHI|nr:porin family protein [Pedobacter africanus]MDR6784780.1 hypothetical protein [Pedobacter africanus]